MKLTKTLRVFVLLLVIMCLYACRSQNDEDKKKTDANNYISEYDYFDVDENGFYYAVVIDGVVVGNEAVCHNKAIYINIDTITEYINGRFYWGKRDKEVLFTCPDKVIKLEDSQIYENEGKMYILAEYVSKYSDIGINVIDKGARRIVIDSKSGGRINAKALKKTEIRIRAEDKGSVVGMLNAKEEITVLGYENNANKSWAKVVNSTGFLGYVKSEDLSEGYAVNITREYEKLDYTRLAMEGKVCLVWHQVLSDDDNAKLIFLMKKAKGVNVVAPTWLNISDESGNLSSKVLSSYVDVAHDIGAKVWVVVSDATTDSSEGDSGCLESILPKSATRAKLIKGIIENVTKCGADGVNVDFANVSEKLEDDYIQFLQELSVECRRAGLVLAVNGNECNIKAEGEIADYYVVKGYNEHTKGSDKAGSVASISFVKDGIDKALLYVPAEKIINGVPLFTRLWLETKSGGNETGEEGKTTLSSKVIGMQAATLLLAENLVTPMWQEAEGQHYGEFVKDGITYKVWLEDADSMKLRLDYIKECGLAGVGCWKLGMEDSSIWSVFNDYLRICE